MDKFTSTYAKMLGKVAATSKKTKRLVKEQTEEKTTIVYAITSDWLDEMERIFDMGIVFFELNVKYGNQYGQEFYIKLVVPSSEEEKVKTLIIEGYGDVDGAIEQSELEVTKNGAEIPAEIFLGERSE